MTAKAKTAARSQATNERHARTAPGRDNGEAGGEATCVPTTTLPAPPAGFDLQALALAEIETNPSADLHVVAEHITKLVPEEHLREALGIAMGQYLRQVLRSYDNKYENKSVQSGEDSTEPRNRWTPNLDLADWHLRVLRQREALSLGDGAERRFLGECTRDEVLKLVEIRKTMARGHIAAAERYSRVADAMAKHKAKTVADLAPEALLEAMQ